MINLLIFQHGMLLPPNSLETLAVSPFKAAAAQMRDGNNPIIATSFDQAMSLPLGTTANKKNHPNGPHEQESSADVEPPFVGSFPTPGAAFDLFSRMSSTTRSVQSGTALGAAGSGLNGTDADEDYDLPFAVDISSEHASQYYGEASATTYAQQYSNPQRLQLFESLKASSSCEKKQLSASYNTASAGGLTEQELADQLADFHTFGATLSRIAGAPGNDGGGGSGEAQTVAQN